MSALLNELSLGELFALGVAGIALFWLSGAVINALLQDRSLGIVGNAAVLVMGATMGFWVKILIFGPVVAK